MGDGSRRDLTTVVLAGGLSSRFGTQKALATLSGKPLIRHVADRMSGIAVRIIVVLGRGEPPQEFERVLPPSVKVLNDELEGKTPLIGILTGLRHVETDRAAILACDIPFVNGKVIELLHSRASNSDAAIPRWSPSKIEPLEAVYRRVPTIKATEQALKAGRLSVFDIIDRLNRVVYVAVQDEIKKIDPELTTFFNVNTKEQLTQAEGVISRRQSS